MQRSGIVAVLIALLLFGAGLYVSYMMTRDRVQVEQVLGRPLPEGARLVSARESREGLIAEISFPESQQRVTLARVSSKLSMPTSAFVEATKKYSLERTLDPAWPEILIRLGAAHVDARRMFRERELALPSIAGSAYTFEGRRRTQVAVLLLLDAGQSVLVVARQKGRDFDAATLEQLLGRLFPDSTLASRPQ
jgi:hypothetical protein